MDKRKIVRYLLITLSVILGVLVFLSITGTVAHAAGLVDNTVSDANTYSKYPLENYQLDFYVDSSWDWLPWNWLDGIGKSIQYGLYAITNFVWTVSLYISNATGYVVQEAYKLDFISDTASSIGKNIQTLAGVTSNGFSSEGFYVGFLLILIVVKNTHEAIIDEETFELVQKFISVKKRPNKTGRPNMFVGLVKCPDCGRNMAFSNPNGREPRFRCRTYARNSNLCTTHAISYDALVKVVMDDIQKHIKNMETLGDQFIEEMRVLSESGGGKKIKQFKQELELAEKRIAEIDSIIMKLFEQNVAGKISDGRFEKMSVTYENEQRELEERRKALKEKIEAEDYKTKNTNKFLETIRKYENVTELNRSMLVELIDSIYVYQAEGTGKERTQKVEINYRFLCESQCGIA